MTKSLPWQAVSIVGIVVLFFIAYSVSKAMKYFQNSEAELSIWLLKDAQVGGECLLLLRSSLVAIGSILVTEVQKQ